MKSFLNLIFVVGMIGRIGFANADSKALGEQLAKSMQDATLIDFGEITGILKTRTRRGKRSSQEFSLETEVFANRRRSIFTVIDTKGNTHRLTILRRPNIRSRYFLSQSSSETSITKLGNEVSPKNLMRPFVGSDFWIADLGLDFFHWSHQNVIHDSPIKMRKGIACEVLESRRGEQAQNGYVEVRSWISSEHGGLIYAEAFDIHGKRIKTFEVVDVEKIGGKWKLRKLRIRNRQTRSTTELIFDN